MRKILLMILTAVVIFPAVSTANPKVTQLPSLGSFIEKMEANGEYEVYILKGNNWQKAGSLSFDKLFREQKIDLSTMLNNQGAETGSGKNTTITIRLIQKGGGAAHIDSVFFGDLAPVKVTGSSDTFALKKVSKKDHDVIDAFGKSLEFSFPATAKNKVLSLTARIESTVIDTTPFNIPYQAVCEKKGKDSKFLPYKLDSQKGSFALGKEIDHVTAKKPFFREYLRSGSGHPSGHMYIWVMNDGANLYVAIDLTPDNTVDGHKDYTKVYVKANNMVKEFKLSEGEQKWGKPYFTYTDKVSYQHKFYEFKIPFKEIGITKAEAGKEIRLAFDAYGTCIPATGNANPRIAYDTVYNRYLAVYTKLIDSCGGGDLYAQLIDSNGAPFGVETLIATYISSQNYGVAYDSVNRRFLIVWDNYSDVTSTNDIFGQSVNANGSLNGINFLISDEATSYQYAPTVTYDSFNRRFLVVWHDWRSGSNSDIYGQLVNANGTLFGTASNVNFAISAAANEQSYPTVAYDSVNHRFLAVWQDYRSVSTYDIYGQLIDPDGTLNGTDFAVSNEGVSHQQNASIAFNSANQRFLVAWTDSRNPAGVSPTVYGQLVNANAALYGAASSANFCIYSSGGHSPSVVNDSANNRFLVAFVDSAGDIYGRVVNPDQTLTGSGFPIALDQKSLPAAAYNSSTTDILVASQDDSINPPDIVFSSVGALDSDGDGVPDALDDQPFDCQVATPLSVTGTGKIIMDTSLNAGTCFANAITLSEDNPSLNSANKPTCTFKDGLAGYKITGVAFGGSVQVQLTFPSGIGPKSRIFKTSAAGFYEFTDIVINGNIVTLTLTDGGAGDSDGLANGIIEDPVGIATSDAGIGTGGFCFIATAAYGSYLDPHVAVLREFRDEYLLKDLALRIAGYDIVIPNVPGKALVALYYKVSPPIADFIAKHETLRTATRWALTPVVHAAGHPGVSGLMLMTGIAVIFMSRRRRLS